MRSSAFGAAVVILVTIATFPAAAPAAPVFGSLTQLFGPFGCASASGPDGCEVVTPLRGAASVVVSPDGRNVYAAANNSGAVVTFQRNPRSGVIFAHSCVGGGAEGDCSPARGLVGAFSVAISPDGRHVYVAGFRTLVVLARNTRSGALTQLPGTAGCASQVGGEQCAQAHGLESSASVAVSPDGGNVYVASSGSSAVAVFRRDADTGQVTQLPGADGCVSQGGTEGCATARGLAGAFSVVVSPNGRHAYVASLNSDAVAAFARDPDDGSLIQFQGPDGCISQSGAEGCTPGRGLDGPNGVTVSADGRHVYVASSGSGAIAAFTSDLTGPLDQLDGALGCTSQGGLEGCSTGRALAGAYAVTASLDGANVYAVSSNAVISFLRNPRSGALTEPREPEACTAHGGLEGCATGRALREASSVALPPDGRNAYVASYVSNAVTSFARNPQRTSVGIRVRGLPKRCARRNFKAVVAVRSRLPVRHVRVFLDRRRLGRRDGARRVAVRIATRRLREGRHRFGVKAVDVGGNRGRRMVPFRRCPS